MSLVLKTARLMICPCCKKHGFILFSGDTRSSEFHSIPEALAEIKSARLQNDITQFEADILSGHIRASDLSHEPDDWHDPDSSYNQMVTSGLVVREWTDDDQDFKDSKSHTLH